MNLKSRLVKALEALSAELERSGKRGTAKYYHDTKGRIESDCNGDMPAVLELLKELESSGAITQYANFSAAEDRLWQEVYESASKWVEYFEQLP